MTDIQMIMKMRDEINRLTKENTDLTLKNCDLTGKLGIYRNRLTHYVTILDRLNDYLDSETTRLENIAKVEIHSTDTIKEIMFYHKLFEVLETIYQEVQYDGN